jgi:Family of unknown function (DUF5989)
MGRAHHSAPPPPLVLCALRAFGVKGKSMAFEGSREKLGLLAEIWAFMRVRKKWWLGPILLMLALLGLLVVFTQGTAIAPFIYTLF